MTLFLYSATIHMKAFQSTQSKAHSTQKFFYKLQSKDSNIYEYMHA